MIKRFETEVFTPIEVCRHYCGECLIPKGKCPYGKTAEEQGAIVNACRVNKTPEDAWREGVKTGAQDALHTLARRLRITKLRKSQWIRFIEVLVDEYGA